MGEKTGEYKEESILNDVVPEKCFWAVNGAVIKNLRELEPAIENMGEHDFRKHVNREKNDFSNWVKEAVNDEELASKMSQTRSKIMTQLLVVKRVLHLLQKNG